MAAIKRRQFLSGVSAAASLSVLGPYAGRVLAASGVAGTSSVNKVIVIGAGIVRQTRRVARKETGNLPSAFRQEPCNDEPITTVIPWPAEHRGEMGRGGHHGPCVENSINYAPPRALHQLEARDTAR